eukprot:jgi/Orpsp1_1/1179875/evm.model.c7180000071158.1
MKLNIALFLFFFLSFICCSNTLRLINNIKNRRLLNDIKDKKRDTNNYYSFKNI